MRFIWTDPRKPPDCHGTGLIATVVLLVSEVMKGMIGVMPALDLPAMFAGVMKMGVMQAIGWVANFVIGIVLH